MNLLWALLILAVSLGIVYRFLRWLYDLGWTHGFERGRLRGEREEIVRRAQAMAEAVRLGGRIAANSDCTEASASWCPVHGTCSCPYDPNYGYRREMDDGIDEACPLHGAASQHGGQG